MTTVEKIRGAYVWRSGFAVDADGSPRAYAMPGSGLVGLDAIANAGHPDRWLDSDGKVVTDPYLIEKLHASGGAPGYTHQHKHWWALVCDANGDPIAQGPNDPAPGYPISTTSLVDHSKAAADPARYVDAEKVPYVVVPPDLLGQRGVRLGDVAMVVYGSQRCGAVVADVGPQGHYGEGSIALAAALGFPTSPRNGGARSGATFLVWPGEPVIWPCSNDTITARAEEMFTKWGGLSTLQMVA